MVELKTLGPPLVTSDGEPVALQPKRLALFAYLAMAEDGAALRRDVLLGVFWPEQDGSHARASLRQALRGLRQALGDEILVTRGDEEVGLRRDNLVVDTHAFQQAVGRQPDQALTLYGGPFLHGFHLSGCPEFEHWVDTERDRQARAFSDAVVQTAQMATQAGDYDAAAAAWRRLVLHDPYSARAVIGLITVLAAAGLRAEALAQFGRYVEQLRRDLDVEPEADVVALAEAVRNGESEVGVIGLATVGKPTGSHAAAVAPWKTKRVRARTGVAATAIAVAAAWLIGGTFGRTGEPADLPRLLVLPMENLSGSEDDYFADGMTEEITAKLSGVSGLRVIARQTAIQYQESSKTAREIGEELDVDYVLESTVRTDRDSAGRRLIRITPQLIRSVDETHVWAEPYTVEPVAGEIFRLQASIAARIAEGMDVALLDPERRALAVHPTDNSDAYDYYLRGESYRSRALILRRAADHELAAEMFERVVELDPGYADVYGVLASTYAELFSAYLDMSAGAKLEDVVRRATTTAPDHPASQIALGEYHWSVTRQLGLAEQHFQAAHRAQPTNAALLRRLGHVKARQGKFDESLATHEAGLELDPRSEPMLQSLGGNYYRARRYAEAEPILDRLVAFYPDSHYGHFYKMMLYLSRDGAKERARGALTAASDRTDLLSFFLVSLDFDDAMVLRLFADHFDDALRRRALWETPDDSAAYYLAKADAIVRDNQSQTGQAYYDSARVVLERRLELLPGNFRDRGSLGLAYAHLARFHDARRERERAFELASEGGEGHVWFVGPTLAQISMLIGEYDAAVDRLGHVLANPSFISVPLLRLDPVWDPLRDHPGFRRLLERAD